MEKYNFDTVRKSGALLYEYIRGSQAYGTALPTSDVDMGGVYICRPDTLYGLRGRYQEQIADDKNDVVWYELGRYVALLLESNPNMIESLYIPDRCVVYEHPIIKELKTNRDMFLTQECFKSFIGYATTQIQKARGLNKKCVNQITERKTPIDFCFTFKNQGTTPISAWLDENGLKQIYCGLNHLPNMNQMYGLFYDWGQHLHMEWKTPEEFANFMYNASYWSEENKQENMAAKPFIYSIQDYNPELWQTIKPLKLHEIPGCDNFYQAQEWNRKRWIKLYHEITPKGYHGIQKESGTSNDIHLDSIVKFDKPLCYMSYNEDGYQSHCKQYKEYKDWEKKRNPQRYLENMNNGRGYDAKKVAHSVRLLHMGIEIATTGHFNVDRTNIDRDLILDIRAGKYKYEELIERLVKDKACLDDAIKTTKLPVSVNADDINQLLIDLRNKYYSENGKQ